MAQTSNDFTFLGEDERHIKNDHSLTAKHVNYLTCEWRHQKNDDNGQKVTFAGDRDNPNYCVVEASLRVYHRSKRLGMKDHEPMGVYGAMGKTHFITARKTTALLREAAHHVLGLSKTDPEIKLWSTHSIRVTAANLLHRMRLTDSFIMKRLRWNSDRFLMYLRNTIHAANTHTSAINVKMSQKDLKSASYRTAEAHESIGQTSGPPA